jgi:hypothetical protein
MMLPVQRQAAAVDFGGRRSEHPFASQGAVPSCKIAQVANGFQGASPKRPIRGRFSMQREVLREWNKSEVSSVIFAVEARSLLVDNLRALSANIQKLHIFPDRSRCASRIKRGSPC